MNDAIIEVPEWEGGRLANGEFLDYTSEIARVMDGFDAEALNLATTLAELKKANAALVDFINESRGSVDTAEIAALDARRDALANALFAAVEKGAEADGDGDIYDAFRHLKIVLSAYKGLARHSLTKETEEIKGLKLDLEKTASVNALKNTGLYKIAGVLFEVNGNLAAAYSRRTDAKGDEVAARNGETTVSLRKKAAALAVRIIGVINALNRISPTDSTISAANRLGAVVAQYKLVASQHRKHKDAGETPALQEDADKEAVQEA